jgi:REP element-mobilizing transposase RayT
MRRQGITTPVIWVAAIHDDHTDKNHVHALAVIQGRLDKPDLCHIHEAPTAACLRERRELDLARERQARERTQQEWELEPELEEDAWGQ